MTEKQALLIVKAQRRIRPADDALTRGDYDIAASSAYYAMFYCAQAVLLEKNLRFSKHSAVIGAIGHHFAATGLIPTEFHRNLLDAQDARNTGDYIYEQELAAPDVIVHAERAKRFLEFVNTYLGAGGHQA